MKKTDKTRNHWTAYVTKMCNNIEKALINKDFDAVDKMEQEILTEMQIYKTKHLTNQTEENKRILNEHINLMTNFFREAAYIKAAQKTNEKQDNLE